MLAHRVPGQVMNFAKNDYSRGIRVIIGDSGGAAHLPDVVEALPVCPVIGVPVKSSLSIVAPEGGRNAAIIAAQILVTGEKETMNH